MSEDKNGLPNMPDAGEMAQTWSEIADKTRALIDDFVKRESEPGSNAPDAAEIELAARPFQTFFERVSQDPSQLIAAQMALWQDSMALWQNLGQRALGMDAEAVIKPASSDRRFRDEAWQENPLFDFIKQSYLLTSKFMTDALPEAESGDDKRSAQLNFHTQQFIDAMSPSNFAATNPAVLRETVSSGGENLVNGLKNLLGDLERGKGQLRVKMTDTDKFEVGKNVGTTAGKVVFETPLMQLIQYEPTTPTVYRRPLVIIPPWINKFYILDLQPANSFIRWAVSEGHTVFVISWV
ncbi:MAG: polyhydroxyalkanoate synthase, partial [Gammaproteobacteria bacterium]